MSCCASAHHCHAPAALAPPAWVRIGSWRDVPDLRVPTVNQSLRVGLAYLKKHARSDPQGRGRIRGGKELLELASEALQPQARPPQRSVPFYAPAYASARASAASCLRHVTEQCLSLAVDDWALHSLRGRWC